jgi:ribosomal protein S18 acetylase RimI-like enzyme
MTEANPLTSEFDQYALSIERAVPEDAEVINSIRDQARLQTYPNAEHGITAEDMQLIIQGQQGEFVPRRVAYYRQQIIDGADSTLAVYVAKINGEIVGFTHPQKDEKGRLMIGDMFVAPAAQGKGVGGHLMEKALDVLGRDHDIYLEVVSYNQNAISFYRRFGFEKTDAEVPKEAGRPTYLKSLPQIEMIRPAGS